MTTKIPARPGPRQDDGFFGPDSVTWEISRHPIVTLVNAMNGAAYTALSSETSQAVVDHSKQFTDPIGRSKESVYWLITSVFGDKADATRAGKWVYGKHTPVKGNDPVSNTKYSPHRPDLALSGHCLIWDGSIRAYEAYVRKLSANEIDQFWREGLIAAQLMGIDTETAVSMFGSAPVPFPHTRAEWLDIYEKHIHPRLNLSSAARSIIDSTGSGFFAPRWARPGFKAAFWASNELMVAVMDPRARAIYGRPRSDLRAASTRAAGRPLARLLELPPVREGFERGLLGERCHELLTEARAIRRRRQNSMPQPT